MIRRSKPLERTALKAPTLEAVRAWEQKPRRALPRGKRQGRNAKREAAAWILGRALVVERSGGFCEGPQVVGVHPTGKHSGHHVHHVLSRGRGGGHEPANLLHLCDDLHRHVHARPAWAQSVGLLASRGPERGVVSEP